MGLKWGGQIRTHTVGLSRSWWHHNTLLWFLCKKERILLLSFFIRRIYLQYPLGVVWSLGPRLTFVKGVFSAISKMQRGVEEILIWQIFSRIQIEDHHHDTRWGIGGKCFYWTAVSSTYNFDMCVQWKCDTVQHLVESSIPVTWDWQWWLHRKIVYNDPAAQK